MTAELPGGLWPSAALAIAVLVVMAVGLRRELFWSPRRGMTARDPEEPATALGRPPGADDEETEEYHGYLWWDPVSALSDTRGCGWLLAEFALFVVLLSIADGRMPEALHPLVRDALGFVAACAVTGLIGRTVYTLVTLLREARSSRR